MRWIECRRDYRGENQPLRPDEPPTMKREAHWINVQWASLYSEYDMNSLKDMVKDNKRVTFKFYRDRNLWYSTECNFEFPVPISDVGNATFLAEDRAILFMRYIRKHLDVIAKADNNAQF